MVLSSKNKSIKKERNIMAKIKRQDEKVWLDLDPYYPPKFKQPVTDFKAIAITLKTL